VSEDDKEAARTAYLRRHPDAFWVIINFLKSIMHLQFCLFRGVKEIDIFLSKVDFGDFSFIHVKPKYVHYVSGIATALLGSGGNLHVDFAHMLDVDSLGFNVKVVANLSVDVKTLIVEMLQAAKSSEGRS
ncbi:hypothetical protein BHE74_00032576, partial [Ensete ventricosum]